ncbi:MAG: hypothetical protein AAF585_19675 [Verrucomicrobiota bacterium]
MLEILINHLMAQGLDASIKATSNEEGEIFPDKFICKAALLPKVMMVVGLPLFIAATIWMLRAPDEKIAAIAPAGISVLLIYGILHYWTLKIEASGHSLKFGSCVRPEREIRLDQPFEFKFDPAQTTLKIKQGRAKITINHYFDGYITLFKWIIWIGERDSAKNIN